MTVCGCDCAIVSNTDKCCRSQKHDGKTQLTHDTQPIFVLIMKFKMILSFFGVCRFWCSSLLVSMRNLFVFAFNRTECWFYCHCYCTIDTWMHVIHPYERFEIKLNWEENTKIVFRFYCVKISRLRIFLPQMYISIECVCNCARMCCMCALLLFYLCVTYCKRVFRRRTTKIIETSKRWSFWAFVFFHTLTLTHTHVFARVQTHCPKLDICFGCYSFMRFAGQIGAGNVSGFVQYSRLYTTTIISNWWVSRSFDFEKMWKWYTTFHV